MYRDKGEDANEVLDLLAECGCTAHMRAWGEEAKVRKQEAGFKAHRWVVARTPRWRNRFRRILCRWDKTVRNSLALLHRACADIPCNQAGLCSSFQDFRPLY